MTIRHCTLIAALAALVTYTIGNVLLIKDLTR
jgi:hypothetical protein